MKLMIKIPTWKQSMCEGLVQWLGYISTHKLPFPTVWGTVHDRPEDSARNRAVVEFLKSDCTHLMMIDDDITPPVHAWELATHDLPVVSAVVYMLLRGCPQALILKKSKDGYQQDHEAIAKINSGKNRLVNVDASGTGCFVVERSVLEAIGSNWFRFQYDEIGIRTLGEDYHFYQQVKKHGFQAVVDGNIVCDHVIHGSVLGIQNYLTHRLTRVAMQSKVSGD